MGANLKKYIYHLLIKAIVSGLGIIASMIFFHYSTDATIFILSHTTYWL